MSELKKETRFQWHEDWVTVVLGFMIILIAMAGFKLPAPAYSWKTTDELFSKILSGSNMLLILLQFTLVLVIAGVGAFLTGKSLGSVTTGFPIIFAIATIAMILAGN